MSCTVLKTRTPAYVFNKKKLIDCYEKIKVLMANIRIYYALKANSTREVLFILSSIGADFEVASLGEYNALMALNVSPERIICGLPVKPTEWLKYMYDNGCNYFVFDTISELSKIVYHAPRAKKILRIRISDILSHCIDFGMSYDEIMCRLTSCSHLAESTDGISFHISNNVVVNEFNNVIERIDVILKAFNKRNMILNIGGGYRINAEESFFDNLNNKIRCLVNKYAITVIAEPGNTIVNSSGRIITTVVGVKKREAGRYDLYIDAGKPSGIKTNGKRIPGYIKQITRHEPCEEREYRFIDITCMHSPHFSIALKSPVYEGDVFEFGNMGAYSICLRSDFHLWNIPDVIVD